MVYQEVCHTILYALYPSLSTVDAKAALAKVYSGVMDPVPGPSRKTDHVEHAIFELYMYNIYICTFT